jgi:hypothetical protein
MVATLRLIGSDLHQFASHGYTPDFREFLERHPIVPGRGTAAGRAALEGIIVHIPDVGGTALRGRKKISSAPLLGIASLFEIDPSFVHLQMIDFVRPPRPPIAVARAPERVDGEPHVISVTQAEAPASEPLLVRRRSPGRR